MAEIKITGLEHLEQLLVETHNNTSLILEVQKKQPEREALLGCINAMQSAVERLILAHEKLAGGATPASTKARHAMSAAQMIKDQRREDTWYFPEGQKIKAFARPTRLVKNTTTEKKRKGK